MLWTTASLAPWKEVEGTRTNGGHWSLSLCCAEWPWRIRTYTVSSIMNHLVMKPGHGAMRDIIREQGQKITQPLGMMGTKKKGRGLLSTAIADGETRWPLRSMLYTHRVKFISCFFFLSLSSFFFRVRAVFPFWGDIIQRQSTLSLYHQPVCVSHVFFFSFPFTTRRHFLSLSAMRYNKMAFWI